MMQTKTYERVQAVLLSFMLMFGGALPAFGQSITLPIATTHPASNVSVASGVGSAVLNGYVNLFGPGNYFFEYGTQSTGFINQTAPVFVNGATQFSALVSNLQANTIYSFRAVGVNNSGITYGTTLTFFTASSGGSGGSEQPTLPLIRTDSGSSNPGSNSAVLNGYVNPFGQTATVLFRYGTSPSGLVNQTVPEDRTTNGFFSAVVTGLTTNTTYFFEAIAITETGTVSGGVRSVFIFPASSSGGSERPVQPTVRTDSGSSSPGSNSAVLNGYVNPFDQEMTVYFEYGLSASTLVNQTASETRTGNGFVSTIVSGLTTNTTYFFQLVGVTAQGTVKGGVRSVFISSSSSSGGSQQPVQPTVRTDSGSSSPGSNSAVLNGYINPFDTEMTVYFEYGLSSSSLVNQTVSEVRTSNGFVSSLVTGLTPNTTYFFQLVGVTAQGTVKGGVRSVFISSASNTGGSQSPTQTLVRTDSGSSSPGSNSAVLNGYVNPFDDTATVYFEYGASPDALVNQTASETRNGNGFFSSIVTGLTSNITYFFQAIAVGANGTVKGGVRSVFISSAGGTGGTQQPLQPIVRTDPGSSSPGSNSATFNAYINPFGDNLTVSFEYGTSAGTLTNQTSSEVRTSNGFFSRLVSGLISNTTYFFRAIGMTGTGNRTEGGTLSVFVPASGGSGSSNQTLAIIRTDPASISGGGSAMLRGYYNSFGDSMTVYFKYGTEPGNLPNQTASKTVSGNGFFEDSLSGLTAGTTYYYSAVGVTSQGTIEGTTVRFVP